MMQPNYFDEAFEEKYAICGNATTEEKVAVILDEIVAKNPVIQGHLAEKIEEFEKSDPIPGPSLSQVVRQELADILNAPILT